jgi:hypothetical protein
LATFCERLTAIGGGGAAVTVMTAAAVFVGSATALAVKVTAGGTGAFAGAVYVIAAPDALPAADSAPHAAPLHPLPDNVQLTPLFAESFATVAVKLVVAPATTLAVVWERLTEIAAGAAVIVMAAVATFVVFATDVAVRATVAGFGMLPGAVYVTAPPDALLAADNVPHAAPVHPAPDSAHVTPAFELSFATVAVNAWPCPAWIDELTGETVTETAPEADTGLVAGLLALEQPQINAIATIAPATKNPGACSAHTCVTRGLL